MNKIHMNWITFAAYKNHASDFLKNVPGHKDQPPTFSFENFSIRFSKEQSPAKSIYRFDNSPATREEKS